MRPVFEFEKLFVERGGREILRGVDGQIPSGAMHAVVGPSGCGKTTLIKALLGLIPSSGVIRVEGRESVGSRSFEGRVGFVPQFGVAHGKLSVREVLDYTARLASNEEERASASRIDDILKTVGLDGIEENRVESLSGGQSRRLSLATELVRNPICLICDEVTSGLDPRAEREILGILKNLVRERGMTVVCVIHNLGRLWEFDSVTVLAEGELIFEGETAGLKNLLGGRNPLELYDYLDLIADQRLWTAALEEGENREFEQVTKPLFYPPGWASQFLTLTRRRWVLLGRDSGYLWLLAALTLGFPCVVVIFALGGLPQLEGLSLVKSGTYLQELQENLRYRMEAAETASLVTGLILFQVVLLALMGANNGSREIADERSIFEKERLGGVRVSSYVASKLGFTGILALAQGFWMTLFVKVICQFPGSLLPQAAVLAFGCLAMTWICLGMSAVLSSGDKASLLSIYLVGFQLPLSGIVLALPDSLVWFLRPLITAYWSWAGYLYAMKDFQVYDAYRLQEASWLPQVEIAMLVLSAQAILGVFLVVVGCRRKMFVG